MDKSQSYRIVVKANSTMYEIVSAQEREVDWHKENNLQYETHTIHGGPLSLITNEGFKSILIISGRPQLENHLFSVEVLTEFLARKGEEI